MDRTPIKDLLKDKSTKQDCMCFALRKAARTLTGFYDNILSETGLRSTQHSLLHIAYQVPNLPISKMAEIAVMDRTTLTRNLKPLVELDLLSIDKDQQDKRIRVVNITRQGIKVFKRGLVLWEKAQQDFTRQYGSSEFDKLISGLSRVVNHSHE